MMLAIEGALEGVSLTGDSRRSVRRVGQRGYPVSSTKGDVIEGLSDATKVDSGDTMVFHAGTSRKGDQVLTAGGRVLSVCAPGHGLKTL